MIELSLDGFSSIDQSRWQHPRSSLTSLSVPVVPVFLRNMSKIHLPLYSVNLDDPEDDNTSKLDWAWAKGPPTVSSIGYVVLSWIVFHMPIDDILFSCCCKILFPLERTKTCLWLSVQVCIQIEKKTRRQWQVNNPTSSKGKKSFYLLLLLFFRE